MKQHDEFEEQLRRVADGPASERMREKVARAEELSEEILIAYFQGMLSDAEMEALGPMIALSEPASEYLDQLQADLEATNEYLAETAPAEASWLDRTFGSLRNLWAVNLRSFAVAGAAAALVLIVLVSPTGRRMLTGDLPTYAPDAALVDGRLKSVVALPDRQLVDRVDEHWPLVEPVGAVAQIARFHWAPIEGANSYRLTVYTPEGDTILRVTDLDGSRYEVGVDESSTLLDQASRTWMVEAVGNDGRVLVRGIRSFSQGP